MPNLMRVEGTTYFAVGLMRRLEAPFEPSETVTGHVSESATNVGEAVVTPTIHVPSREEAPPALGGAQNPTARTQGGAHPVGKLHGRRSKIAVSGRVRDGR